MKLKKNSLTFFIGTAVLCIIPFIVSSDYSRHLCINALIYIMLAQGLNICLGYCGQMSLGQAGFYAIGGYVFAILTTKLGLSWWVTTIVTVVVTALVGFLLAVITMRTRGSAFIIISILFAHFVKLVALNWTDMTNGQAGILSIPGMSLMGNQLTSKIEIYYYVLIFVVVMQFLTERIVDSKIGRGFIAVKQDESLAISIGISPYHYSIIAFTIGVVFSAFAGCFHASYAQMVSPEMADFNNVMLYIIMMVVVGGRGTVWGPVIGAFIFTFLPEYLRLAEMLRISIFGMILIFMVLFIPDGFIPTFSNLKKRIKGLKKGFR